MKIVLGRVHQMRGLNGGMENVCARMANEMIKRGHDVTVISDDPDGGMMYFQYDESTHFVNLADYGEEKAPVRQALFKVMRERTCQAGKQGSCYELEEPWACTSHERVHPTRTGRSKS